MSTKKSKKGLQLVGGKYRPGTTIAKLFLKLSDGQPHRLTDLRSCVTRKGVNLQGRLYWRHESGAKSRAWKIVREKSGAVRLLRTRSTPRKKVAKSVVTQAA